MDRTIRYRTKRHDQKRSQSTRKKRKRAWNRGLKQSTDKKIEDQSTSLSKLRGHEYPESNFHGYRIFDLDLLSKIINDVTCCKLCGGDVVLQEIQTVGLGGNYTLSCQGCNFTQSFSNCSMIGIRKTRYELNQRSVLASRVAGHGLSDLKVFCGIMDLPSPVSPNTFNTLQKTVFKAANDECEKSMTTAINQEIAANCDLESTEDENSDIKELQVRGDGTWQKRGFKSLNGAVSIIGTESEKVLDHEVLSSYCQICTQWQQENGLPTGDKWEDWYSTHRLVCKRNYFGSAGGMESAGMIKIFKRSEEKYNVQYTQFIGDGDSKTFPNIVNAEPYGPEVEIKKLECIGHVGKRFGTHMRKLKISFKGKKLSDGKTLFGKGRLTQKTIVSMQTYYTGAIRNNPTSLSGMIRDIWAIWYHMASTDDCPQHQFCPVGRNSWCKYQRAVAVNELEDFHHNKTLPAAVMDAIRPVFVQMTSVCLLKRCLGGQTQNSNESFNHILWKVCPKNIFVGLDTLKLGAKIATVLFNDGMCGILRIMQRLNCTPGLHAVSAAKNKDKLRLDKAEKQRMEDSKKKRIIYRKLRINLHENFVNEEGNLYEAGAF